MSKEMTNNKHKTYTHPECSVVAMEGEVIAASPNPNTPKEPTSIDGPTSEVKPGENINTAKRHPSFNAWTTWD